MVPAPAPLPTRRPLPLAAVPLAAVPLAAGPLEAGSLAAGALAAGGGAGGAARGGPRGPAVADAESAAICRVRESAGPPRPPGHMRRLHPPPCRPSRSCPSRALTLKVSHNGAGEPLRPRRTMTVLRKG